MTVFCLLYEKMLNAGMGNKFEFDKEIVELNPISCSMCYVNNSIYADVVPEIGECQRQLMMGAEFCYDAIANPKNYDMLRISNKSYTYTSDNQYALL